MGPEGADPVGPAALAAEGDRIDYRRGAITETWENDPNGLSQRITIGAPPSGGDTRLRIGLAVVGDVLPVPFPDGKGVEFVAGSGAAVLRLAELEVTDAREARLEASLALAGCRSGREVGTRCTLEIVAETMGVAWPVTASLLATSPNWSMESNQTGAVYGASVAGAGDVNGDGYADVIVGAPSYDNGQANEGRAFVYHGSASGLSTRASWSDEGDQANAQFGASVAGAGDVNGDGYADLVVGAPSIDYDQTDEGGVFVYLGSSTGLSTLASWAAEGNQAAAQFGQSVAGAGDVNGDGYSDVIVGAPHYDLDETDEGRVEVYHGSASGLVTGAAAVTLVGGQAGGDFGHAVAGAGDVNGDGYADVIVGAPYHDNGQTDEGQAFVFLGSSSGVDSGTSWTGEGNQASARYGWSVAGAGDVNGDGYSDVLVGADSWDDVEPNEGKVSVYHGSASGLTAGAAGIFVGGQTQGVFGYAVAGAGDVNGDGYADVVIGAPNYDNGQTNEGKAWVLYGSVSGVVLGTGWSGESDVESAWYGHAVAGAGDVNGDGYADIIVGAPWYSNGQSTEGRGYVYHGSADGPTAYPAWAQESNLGGAYFGSSVASAGDVNGDGYADIIVGAQNYGDGESYEGSAFVYHGSATGPSATASWSMEGGQADAQCGASVAGAGDVNGDGYADVIVGCPSYGNGQVAEGRAFVYHGSASGLSTIPAWSAEGEQASALFGLPVAGAGDVNGDGYSDVVVGAQTFSNGQPSEGRVFSYLGSASGLQAAPSWTAEINQANARFGCSVAGAGDVNGDGFADVIVGARTYSGGQSGEGGAFVFHGSASGLSIAVGWSGVGGQADAGYGFSVAGAGDLNGDGFGDVVVGARLYDDGQVDEGRAFVYHGSASGLSPVLSWSAESDQANAYFGGSVAGAGDVNGDGFADVVVGAEGFDNGESGEGRAFLYLGAAAGLTLEPGWTAEGGVAAAAFGGRVSGAGDVNGDGFADVIVGAYGYTGGQIGEGRASVFHGNGGTGRKVAARQLRGDGSAPVQPWGGSSDPAAFQVQASHVSPAGREAVRFEVQACPRGVPFGHASCVTTRSSWSDSTATPTGVLLSRTVSGLTAGTLYRWRARTLRMPYSVLAAHTASPPNPAHGPWWRLSGGVVDADIRTRATATLDVSRSGSGAGLVTSNPAGVDCGTDCSQAYPLGTVVTLEATPAPGSSFTGWTGEGCSGTGTCVLTMSQARTVTAVFDLISGPFLSPLGGPIVVGATNTFTGAGFTAGTVLKLFVSTATGPQDTNTSGWTPTTWTPTTLTWEIPPTVPLGQGFATVQVVNTDEGYIASNLVSQLLYGDAADGLPTILTINGVALSPPDPSLPGAHVETVIAAGATVTIGGTGFAGPLVNLFTANGNAGPLTPLAGGTATSFEVVLPSNVPAGPGTLQVVNSGTGYKESNAVDAVLRARITVTSVSVVGSTVNVVGDGFCSLTVINLFNVQGSDVVNLGGLSGGSPLIPLTVTDAQHMSFTLPAGTQSGPAYVQALNPPYTPYTSSGTDPGGAFTVP